MNLTHLEEKHRLCSDIINKMNTLSFLIEEDEAYLKSYYKTAWHQRPPEEYALAKSETSKKRAEKLKQLEKEYNQVVAEIILETKSQKNLVAIAETYALW